jgi:hypothetical protein
VRQLRGNGLDITINRPVRVRLEKKTTRIQTPTRWTPDLDRTIAAMADAGASAREIANTITDRGTPMTRNAVIGRLHRMRNSMSIHSPGDDTE